MNGSESRLSAPDPLRSMNDPRGYTLPDLLARGEAGALALADTNGNGLTYADLRGLVSATGAALADIGIGVDDVVAVSLRNGVETAALLVALTSHCRVAP